MVTDMHRQVAVIGEGDISAAVTLLKDNPSPSEHEIREGISGNLCRCTGYQHIVNAIQNAAKKG